MRSRRKMESRSTEVIIELKVEFEFKVNYGPSKSFRYRSELKMLRNLCI